MCAECSSESSRPNKLGTGHPGKGAQGEIKKRMQKKYNKMKSFSQIEITFGPILAYH